MPTSLRANDSPKRMELELVKRIQSGDLAAGERLCSAREMSEKFKLTYKQAVAVIRKLQQKRYVRSIRGSGTYVCDIRPKANRQSVALAVRTSGDVYGEVTGHLLSQLRDRGVVPAMVGLDGCTAQMREGKINEIFELLLRDHPTAMVLDDIFEDRLPQSLLEYERRGGRIILLFRHVHRPFRCAAQVSPDVETGLYMTTQHLLSHGYEQIAILAHGRRPGQTYRDTTATPRLHGYYRAMREAVPPARTSRIMLRAGHEDVPGRVAEVRSALESSKRPRAIVAESDFMASLALQAAEQIGLRIPEDLAICGCLDVPVAKLLDLTSVSWDWAKMAQTILAEIDRNGELNTNLRHTIYLNPTLVVRGSCGCSPVEDDVHRQQAPGRAKGGPS